MSIIRWGGVAGIMGGLSGLLLSPVVTAAGNLKWDADLPWEGNAPVWLNPFRFIIESLLALPPQGEAYPTYGKTYFFVFLLMSVAALGLKSALQDSVGRTGLRGARLILAGLGLNLFGNIADYWLGYSVLGQPWWGLFFVVGTDLGHLIYAIGSVMLGRAILKNKVMPGWWAWLLMVTALAGFILPYWGVQHVPSGMVLPMSICWLVTGFLLLFGEQPVRSPGSPAIA
jgi:hypothetical protein